MLQFVWLSNYGPGKGHKFDYFEVKIISLFRNFTFTIKSASSVTFENPGVLNCSSL